MNEKETPKHLGEEPIIDLKTETESSAPPPIENQASAPPEVNPEEKPAESPPMENKLDAQPPEKPIEEGKAPDIKPVPESPPAEINKETPVEQAETKEDLTFESAIEQLEKDSGEPIKDAHREALGQTFAAVSSLDQSSIKEALQKNLNRLREKDVSQPTDYGQAAEDTPPAQPKTPEDQEKLSVVDTNTIENLIDYSFLENELRTQGLGNEEIDSAIKQAKTKLPELFNKEGKEPTAKLVHDSIINAVKRKLDKAA